MYLEEYLRKLAKKTEILNQFVASKEMNHIRFFANEMNFSKIQNLFLAYLYFYYNLQQEIASKKVSKKVLECEIYEDAYAYYLSKHDESKDKSSKGKKRSLQAVFSKDNKVIFPQKEVK